ncbi:MAG: paraquat-inducible rane protein, partial [Rhodoferax sp.]|nr:paraquat-inducible rane protein [Rhodoferax sp.]
LVRIQGFAEITAGVGIAAFGGVVVLTMLASLSFDPKLTWDGPPIDDAAEDADADTVDDQADAKAPGLATLARLGKLRRPPAPPAPTPAPSSGPVDQGLQNT